MYQLLVIVGAVCNGQRQRQCGMVRTTKPLSLGLLFANQETTLSLGFLSSKIMAIIASLQGYCGGLSLIM